jgi:hypothetical protein
VAGSRGVGGWVGRGCCEAAPWTNMQTIHSLPPRSHTGSRYADERSSCVAVVLNSATHPRPAACPTQLLHAPTQLLQLPLSLHSTSPVAPKSFLCQWEFALVYINHKQLPLNTPPLTSMVGPLAPPMRCSSSSMNRLTPWTALRCFQRRLSMSQWVGVAHTS